MKVVLFNLYKDSGKWYGDGESRIPSDTELWHDDFVELIAIGQRQFDNEAIISRQFTMTTEAKDDNDFFSAMFLSKNKE